MSSHIYHNHHIIPRHMGGSDDPSNIVRLTVEEHAQAHRKLWEEHGNEKDRVAWLGLSGLLGKEEIIKLSQSIGGKTTQEKYNKKISSLGGKAL